MWLLDGPNKTRNWSSERPVVSIGLEAPGDDAK